MPHKRRPDRRTIVPLDAGLGNSEVACLIEAPLFLGQAAPELVLTSDEWVGLLAERASTRGTEHHRNDTGMARVHVNQAQCGEGRACRRCRHAPHVAARQERRA